MFEEVAPGYYEKQYGPLLSGIAHSGLVAGMWRFEFDFDTGRSQWYEGCVFSDSASLYLINQTWPLIYSFAKYYPSFFPGYGAQVDQKTEAWRLEVMDDLDKWMKEHEAQNAKSVAWHRLIDLLVR